MFTLYQYMELDQHVKLTLEPKIQTNQMYNALYKYLLCVLDNLKNRTIQFIELQQSSFQENANQSFILQNFQGIQKEDIKSLLVGINFVFPNQDKLVKCKSQSLKNVTQTHKLKKIAETQNPFLNQDDDYFKFDQIKQPVVRKSRLLANVDIVEIQEDQTKKRRVEYIVDNYRKENAISKRFQN